MKTLLKIVLSLLALLVALGVVAFLYLDLIVGKAIETGCTKALGVETRVGWVRVGLVTGKFGIGGLEIANPSGFETDHFISFDRIHFEIPPKSLWKTRSSCRCWISTASMSQSRPPVARRTMR